MARSQLVDDELANEVFLGLDHPLVDEFAEIIEQLPTQTLVRAYTEWNRTAHGNILVG